jgi:hypothetical protein
MELVDKVFWWIGFLFSAAVAVWVTLTLLVVGISLLAEEVSKIAKRRKNGTG